MRFIRNLYLPYVGTSTQWGTHAYAMVLKEVFLSMGWTLDSDDADPAWTDGSQIIVDEPGGVNGFEVDPDEAGVIYDPLGRFTSGMVNTHLIFLHPSNDENAGGWMIGSYIDANHVQVDMDGFRPQGWVAETQMPGRVIYIGSHGTRLTPGAWALMNAPAPSQLQTRIEFEDTSDTRIFVRPLGQPMEGTGAGASGITGTAPNMTLTAAEQRVHKHMAGQSITIAGATTGGNNGTFTISSVDPLNKTISYSNASGVAEAFSGTWSVTGIATETPSTSGEWNEFGQYNTNSFMLQAVGEAPNVYIQVTDQDDYPGNFLVGELDGHELEDASPGFLYGYQQETSAWLRSIYMLDGAVSPSVIECYPLFIKPGYDQAENTYCLSRFYSRRLVNGRPGAAPLRSPFVVMENVSSVGGCVRGRLPLVRFTYNGFEKFTPIDAAGNWIHMTFGLVAPRNGPLDQFVIIPPHI